MSHKFWTHLTTLVVELYIQSQVSDGEELDNSGFKVETCLPYPTWLLIINYHPFAYNQTSWLFQTRVEIELTFQRLGVTYLPTPLKVCRKLSKSSSRIAIWNRPVVLSSFTINLHASLQGIKHLFVAFFWGYSVWYIATLYVRYIIRIQHCNFSFCINIQLNKASSFNKNIRITNRN